jgi:hypothetical protein
VVRSEVSRCCPAGPLFHTLLTLIAAPAAGLDIGLMAPTGRRPDDGDWQQPLPAGHGRSRLSRI